MKEPVGAGRGVHAVEFSDQPGRCARCPRRWRRAARSSSRRRRRRPPRPAELIRAFADAGVPAGVINLVFGVPAEISEYLIPHPMIRKISFTGSTAVGKQLAALAGAHMKRVTMELGGHAPAIVFDDADIDMRGQDPGRRQVPQCRAGLRLADAVSGAGERLRPVRRAIHRRAKAVKVGDGLDKETTMGPLANARRVDGDGKPSSPTPSARAPRLRPAATASATRAIFFEPTVLTDVPKTRAS